MLPGWLQVLYRPVPISNAKPEGKGKGKQARASREQPSQQQSSVPEAVDGAAARPVKLLKKANFGSAPQDGGITSAPKLQAEAASQVGCTLCCVATLLHNHAWQQGTPQTSCRLPLARPCTCPHSSDACLAVHPALAACSAVPACKPPSQQRVVHLLSPLICLHRCSLCTGCLHDASPGYPSKPAKGSDAPAAKPPKPAMACSALPACRMHLLASCLSRPGDLSSLPPLRCLPRCTPSTRCLQDAPPGRPPKPGKGPKVRPGFQHYVPGAKRRQQPPDAGDEGSQGGSTSALKEVRGSGSG